MKKLCLTVLLAAFAAPVQAQAPASANTIQASIDTPEQRQALRQLTMCLAEARPHWARATLAHAYLSDDQAKAAAEALSGHDNCLRSPVTELTFRTSTLVGALAEYFVRSDVGRIDLKRLSTALATAEPLNASEDFALCIAAGDPRAALDLVLSDPGSNAENSAASKLGTRIQSCTKPGEQLTVDLQSLRALESAALYRGTSAAAR